MSKQKRPESGADLGWTPPADRERNGRVLRIAHRAAADLEDDVAQRALWLPGRPVDGWVVWIRDAAGSLLWVGGDREAGDAWQIGLAHLVQLAGAERG
jgi:hypothetical protein